MIIQIFFPFQKAPKIKFLGGIYHARYTACYNQYNPLVCTYRFYFQGVFLQKIQTILIKEKILKNSEKALHVIVSTCLDT